MRLRGLLPMHAFGRWSAAKTCGSQNVYCGGSFIKKDASTECMRCLHDGDECCSPKSAANEMLEDKPTKEQGSSLEQAGGGMILLAIVIIGSAVVVILAAMAAMQCRKSSAAASMAPEPIAMVPLGSMASADFNHYVGAVPMDGSIANDGAPMAMKQRSTKGSCPTCGGRTELGRCTVCGGKVDRYEAEEAAYRSTPAVQYASDAAVGPSSRVSL